MLQVLLYHFFGHFSDRRAKIPSRPEMPSPIALLQHRKVFEQLAGRTPFDPPHDLARGKFWRGRYENMDVILAHHPFENADLERFTRLPDQFSNPFPYLPFQNLVPIFQSPKQNDTQS